jgi:hypothetical protein
MISEYVESMASSIELEFVSDLLFRRLTVRGTIKEGATLAIIEPLLIRVKSLTKDLLIGVSEVIVRSAE